MADKTEEKKVLSDKELELVQNLKKDAKFVEHMQNLGFDLGYFDNNPLEVLKAYEDYKAKAENSQEQAPVESKEEKSLEIGGKDPSAEQNEAKPDEKALKVWEDWAEKHNYIFENPKEDGYDYSVNLYKTKQEADAKTPSTTIRKKGDSVFVNSDDINVYRELVRQAKENGYSSVKFLETLTDSQKKYLQIACLEAGLAMTNAPKEFPTNDPIYKDLPDETKEKIKLHDYENAKEKAVAYMTERKQKNPDEPFNLREELGLVEGANAVVGAMLLEEAFALKMKIETHGFFEIPANELAEVPAEKQVSLKKATDKYNMLFAHSLYAKDYKIISGNKDKEVDIKARNDATAQAIAYAICTKLGIKMKNVPDMITSDKIKYLPPEAQKAVEKHNKEYTDRVRAKEEDGKGENPQTPTEEETKKPKKQPKNSRKRGNDGR